MMTNTKKELSFLEAMAAVAEYEQKVSKRLHAYVYEEPSGVPTISCIWSEPGIKACKEVVFVKEASFEGDSEEPVEGEVDLTIIKEAAVKDVSAPVGLRVVRESNSKMKATENVVTLLIEIYESQTKSSLGGLVSY